MISGGEAIGRDGKSASRSSFCPCEVEVDLIKWHPLLPARDQISASSPQNRPVGIEVAGGGAEMLWIQYRFAVPNFLESREPKWHSGTLCMEGLNRLHQSRSFGGIQTQTLALRYSQRPGVRPRD